MADYYVDSAATGTNTGGSWANAWTSFWSLPSLAAGDRVFVSSAHSEGTSGANRTLTGPGSGASPAFVYSVTSGTTTYAAGATIRSTGGAYDISITGTIAMYGCTLESGDDIFLQLDANAFTALYNCTLKPASAQQVSGGTGGSAGQCLLYNCTVDLSSDGASASGAILVGGMTMFGGSVASATNRTGAAAILFGVSSATALLYGVDLSSIPSQCELFAADTTTTNLNAQLVGCKMPATYTIAQAQAGTSQHNILNEWLCTAGTETDRTEQAKQTREGLVTTDTGVTLNSGATTDDGNGGTQQFSWKMVSTAACSEQEPLYTDWIYVWNDTTGSRNLDVYFGGSETLDDAEVWVEYLYLGTSGSEVMTTATTRRATPLTTATVYTTTGGTWSGTGAPTNSYYGRAPSATVNEKGWVLARVALGKASTTIYVDPRIVLS